MKISYTHFNFRQRTRELIEITNDIIAEYQSEGYELTLRQLYYQFVARDIIPNKDSEYKRLGSIINDGRLAGLIDWKAIVDRTRQINEWQNYENPADAINEVAQNYAIDTRQGQNVYVEAWIEKEALAGVLSRAAMAADIPYFSCRGYVSQSAMWRAAQRLTRKLARCSRCVILHLGDHDPSGIDMTRDIRDRLEIFGLIEVEVDRIALNMEQVVIYNPPPNPAKITDSRYAPYREKFGDESWELDAIEPRIITRLVSDSVAALTDRKLRLKRLKLQKEQKAKLLGMAENFDNLPKAE